MKWKVLTTILFIAVSILSFLLYKGVTINKITRMYVVPEQCDVDLIAVVEFYEQNK